MPNHEEVTKRELITQAIVYLECAMKTCILTPEDYRKVSEVRDGLYLQRLAEDEPTTSDLNSGDHERDLGTDRRK